MRHWNPVKTIVKETILLPVRVVQGIAEAVSEAIDIAEGKKPK